MTVDPLLRLAEAFAAGKLSPDEFAQAARRTVTAPLGDAQVDLDRVRRCGYPEVIYGPGKTNDALVRISGVLRNSGVEVLITRVTPEQAAAVAAAFPSACHRPVARTVRIPLPGQELRRAEPAPAVPGPRTSPDGRVVIVSAGTSDLPVAEEALETALWMGCAAELWADLGVAGPQRLAARVAEFEGADAVVVVAGMEGALPSVVAGYVACPVISVPTSVGYGANLGGFSALLSMLNGCAANTAVVNIDAGFKGGYLAGMIARRATAGLRSA